MTKKPNVLIIGAGPSGLFAAENLAEAGWSVAVADGMPSVGRKFLLAGRGGLNLTHSEDIERFLPRYGKAQTMLEPMIRAFPPTALRAWADGLGATSFVGSSGRVFPKAMKASPLLRSWLQRLNALGVQFRLRHHWTGMDADRTCRFQTPDGPVTITADAVLLACGGASWPRLGSNGAWAKVLAERGVASAPFEPSNVGVKIAWTNHIERHFGQPLKRISLRIGTTEGRGEAMITKEGLEGGAIYALSGAVRESLADKGTAQLSIDLRPDLSHEALIGELDRGRKGETQSHALRRLAGLSPAAIAVLREAGPLPRGSQELATRIKTCPLTVTALDGLERAISSVGGVGFSDLNASMMLQDLPGVFLAGEMIDWDAPTGGYLLQACFSTAHAAAHGIDHWWKRKATP